MGFIDGVIAKVGKKKITKAAVKRWGGNANEYNNLDNAFFVLATYGTVAFAGFPYVNEKQSAKFYRKNLTRWNTMTKTKIKDRTELLTPSDLKGEDFIDKTKSYIADGVPIICAINQNKTVCTIEFAGDETSIDNHIVTLLGYDSIKRIFIVRNNYDCCECNIEIGYERFLKCLRWAYILELSESEI